MTRTYNGVICEFKCEPNSEGVIYVMTFPNGKRYVGQTVQKLRQRMKQHCADAINRSKSYSDVKSKAIRKYKRFSVEVVYTGSVDDLNKKEDNVIEHLRKEGYNLYNTANGGLNNCEYFGIECVVTDKEFNALKEFDRVKDAKKYAGGCRTSVKGRYYLIRGKYYVMHKDEYRRCTKSEHKERALKHKEKLREQRGKKKQSEPKVDKRDHYDVVQFNHRREIVRIMDIHDAIEEYGTLIKRAVKEGAAHRRAYGFYWLTQESYSLITDIAQELRGLEYIYKINDEGEVVKEYPNIKEAAITESVDERTIRDNIRAHTIYTKEGKPYFFMKSTEYHSAEMTGTYLRSRTVAEQTSKPIKVYKFGEDMKFIAEYQSKKACARANNTTPQRISVAIATGEPYRGAHYSIDRRTGEK